MQCTNCIALCSKSQLNSLSALGACFPHLDFMADKLLGGQKTTKGEKENIPDIALEGKYEAERTNRGRQLHMKLKKKA